MWLDNAERTVVQNSRRFHHSSAWVSSKEEVKLSSSGLWRVTSMNGILSSVTTEKSSDGTWCLHLSRGSISWPDKISPFLNSSSSNEFHADTHIANHESLQITKEWFSNMFAVEYIGSFLSKFRHLQFIDLESLALDCVNNLANILV